MTTSTAPDYSTEYCNSSPDITFAFSAVIAMTGTLVNALSLSYFMSKIKVGTLTRNADATTTKLFVLLNVSDLLLSISALSYFASLQIYDRFPSFLAVSYLTFSIAVFATSFLTCSLAVIRAIYLVLPLHAIKWWLVKVSMILFGVVVFFLLSMRSIFTPTTSAIITSIVYHARFFIVVTSFIVVLVSNGLAMGKLLCSHSMIKKCSTIKRNSTITVGIISVLYCIFNIGFLVIAVVPLHSMKSYRNIPIEIVDTLVYIALPLNSACNPVVYFIRRSEMRSYLKALWERFAVFCHCMNTAAPQSTSLML